MNPWSIATVLATAVAWSAAAFVLRSAPGRDVSRRLAVLLFVEGTAVITTESGLLLLADTERTARVISLVHVAADLTVLTLYLPFLASALSIPALRVFRARAVELGLFALGIIGVLAIALFPRGFIGAAQRLPEGDAMRWTFSWGPMWQLIALGLVIMYTIGVIASFRAWRAAESDTARRRARAFMWAFGTRDIVWGGIYLFAMLMSDQITVTGLAWLLQLYAGSLLVYALLIGYGILTAQLFDIELKVRWTIKQGTVAAAFVAVFFLVSESATVFFSNRLGDALGLIASAGLVFAIVPLQRLADRVATRAMPGVRDTPEYASYRKLQVYAAALEGAYQDATISERERAMLARISESLGLHPRDAEQLERDVQARFAQTASR